MPYGFGIGLWKVFKSGTQAMARVRLFRKDDLGHRLSITV